MSSTRFPQLTKKWQRMAALGRKHLTWRTAAKEVDKCCISVASKGNCAVYTTDGARFEVPLACPGTTAFAELLQMSKEEFDFMGGDRRITLPASAGLEKAFLITMAMPCYSANHVAPYVAACC